MGIREREREKEYVGRGKGCSTYGGNSIEKIEAVNDAKCSKEHKEKKCFEVFMTIISVRKFTRYSPY